MNETPDPFDDPIAAPPVAVRRVRGRTTAEAIRHVLAEEGIPATVERDRARDAGPDAWMILVAALAEDDADRALANREALAAGIDWDEVDVGELSPKDARLLATAPRRRMIARILLSLGTMLVLAMVVLGLLAMIADLIPSGS